MAEGKLPQVLQIKPSRELVFQGPFTDVVTSYMTLSNPSQKCVCFKVKTTAPKQYCVRPNSGIIAPGDSKTVTVMLQPMDGIPNDAGRHKFMVQSCNAPSEDIDLDTFWKTVNSSNLMYSKLMVVFHDKRQSGDSSDGLKEDNAASSTFNSEYGVAPSIPSGDSNVATLKKSLSMALEEKDRFYSKCETLQKEVDELFKKHRKLQQQNEGLGEVGVPTLQVVLMVVAALLIGLIMGRVF